MLQQISNAIANSDRTVIIKSRQVGMTSIALDIALTEASTKKDFIVVYFTKTMMDASLVYRKAIKQITAPYTKTSSQHGISFEGFGTIYFLPRTITKPILGKRIGLALFDEAAFMDDLDQVLKLVYPAADKLVLFSTPYLKKGVFYEAINSGEPDLKVRLKAICDGDGFEIWQTGGWTKIAFHYKANPSYDPTLRERCNVSQEYWDNEFELGFL